jgi:hypothetical protein
VHLIPTSNLCQAILSRQFSRSSACLVNPDSYTKSKMLPVCPCILSEICLIAFNWLLSEVSARQTILSLTPQS